MFVVYDRSGMASHSTSNINVDGKIKVLKKQRRCKEMDWRVEGDSCSHNRNLKIQAGANRLVHQVQVMWQWSTSSITFITWKRFA